MHKHLSLAAILSFINILSGCASELGLAIGLEKQKWMEQEFIFYKDIDDPEALSKIRTIALLSIPNPHHYLPYNLNQDPSKGSKEQKYKGLNFSSVAEKYHKDYLETEGFHVILVGVERENQYKLVDDYSRIHVPEADAFLDIVPVEVGFELRTYPPFTKWPPFPSEVWPRISVVVRLVSAHSKEILYAESIQYGHNLNPLLESTRITTPPDHKLENKDALKSQNEKAVEQLEYGINAVSRVIAKKISR